MGRRLRTGYRPSQQEAVGARTLCMREVATARSGSATRTMAREKIIATLLGRL